ncbi:MAG: energy transducer TonB, partial [Kofleriaceae bacterium]|nr:energy transducer TonB [Kofleriaceae bacterium]
ANTFSVPVAGLPASFPIFELIEGRFYLHFQDNMDGRISQGDLVRTTSQLRQDGAIRRGQHWVYPLDENARGKISLGAMTLLFQFVTPPPLAAQMRLPASTRKTLADRFEPKLTAILSASVLVHLAIGVFAYTRDLTFEPPAVRYARTYSVKQYVPLIPQEAITQQTVANDSSGVSSILPTAVPNLLERENKNNSRNSKKDRTSDSSRNGQDSPSQAVVDETIKNTVVVSVLSGLTSPNGVFGQMSDTNQGASLDKSLHLAKRKNTSTIAMRGRHRDRMSETIGEGRGKRASEVDDTAIRKEKKKDEQFDVDPPTVGVGDTWDDSDLDPAAVAKRVRKRYLGGIRRCHQRALVGNPQAHGKVVVEFTVGPTGRVTRASAEGFDASVDKCIKSIATRWHFSAPRIDGKPTSASYSIPLLLKKPRQ